MGLLLCLAVVLWDEPATDAALQSVFVDDSAEWSDELKAEFQALDDDRRKYFVAMLTENWPRSKAGSTGELTVFADGISIDQILTADSAIVSTTGGKVWLTGINTSDLADDDAVNCDGFAFVSEGNQTYTTVIGGTKTVDKLRGFSVRHADELIQSVLARRGYRMFKVERVESRPWIIVTVSSITKLSVSVTEYGQKKPFKLSSDYFDAAGRAWLSDKANVKAMQKTKREWDASEKLKKQ